MRNQLGDGRPVAHDEAFEAPFAAQHGVGEPCVPGAGYARVVVERRHETGDARIDRRLERWQVDLAHRPLGDLGLVVFPSRLGRAVAGKMFDGGEDVLLEAAHPRGG